MNIIIADREDDCIFLYFVATCSVCTEFQKDKNEKIEEIRPDMTI